mgnify:CR=1 FL=1
MFILFRGFNDCLFGMLVRLCKGSEVEKGCRTRDKQERFNRRLYRAFEEHCGKEGNMQGVLWKVLERFTVYTNRLKRWGIVVVAVNA